MNSRDERYQASSMILMAEDDPDDRFLMARAFKKLGLDNEILTFLRFLLPVPLAKLS